MRYPVWLALIALAGCGASQEPAAEAEQQMNEPYLVYFGTGLNEPGKGIYVSSFDPASGSISAPELAAEAGSPGFLEIHPNGQYLYAALRTTEGDDPFQGVGAYSIDHETGKLTLINRVSGVGQGPAHVTVDPAGKSVAIANYSSGSVASFKILPDGGVSESVSFIQHEGSSVNPDRQGEPHAHSVNFSPDGQYLIVADLGTDDVFVYRHDPATSEIAPHHGTKVAPGSGPRHFTFHPSGETAYVVNELLNTVTAFDWGAAAGVLIETQTIPTLPADYAEPSTTSEVLVHPTGKFLYAANRGHNSIAAFAVDDAGKLTFIERAGDGIDIPRNFRIDPTGGYLFVANQNGNNVNVFRIDATTGKLTATGDVLPVERPMCVRFVKR